MAASRSVSANPVQLIEPVRREDPRGWFSEVHSDRDFAARGIDVRFVQDNHSLSRAAFTVRGLHFQVPPHAQAKLVRCVRGRIFDVAVDIRSGSPSFGRWVGAALSADDGRQLFVPEGFAHAFMTLEDDCEVIYKVSSPYAAEYDRGLRWDDPAIGIAWPLPHGGAPVLSDKDAAQPSLADFISPFPYDGRPLAPLG